MSSLRRSLARFTSLFCGALFACISMSARAQEPASPILGRASCAASTCHGGVVGRGEPWRHSLTRWAAEDPHSEAGLVLYNQLSESIVTLLDPAIAKLKQDNDPGWQVARDNLLRQRCISCHGTATAADCDPTGKLDPSFLAEGVSCEACHGGAADWIDAHIATGFGDSTGSDPTSVDQAMAAKLEVGMKDTETIVGRATGCARCHVGSRTADGIVRDMNHDIIAAGHPVLRFDLLLYDASLPQHWDQASSARFYESPVRVRQVGRAATLAAAAKLAAERAQRHLDEKQQPWDKRTVPFPELSDYDCFACHQSLSMDQYALPPGNPKSKLRISDGLPIWNSWHTTGQQDLKKEWLEVLAPNNVDAGKLVAVGQGFAKSFLEKARAQSQTDHNALEVLKQTRQSLKDAPRDWHEAAIAYLDIDAALRQLSQNEANGGSFQQLHRRFLSETQGLLRFKAGYDSPSEFGVRASSDFQKKVLEVIPEQTQTNQPNLTN